MTFRQRVYLRLVFTFAAAAALTVFAIDLAASAQGDVTDMPLYFVDTLGCLNRWSMRDGIGDKQCGTEHGGMVYLQMSPDARTLLSINHAVLDDTWFDLHWVFYDAQTFEPVAAYGANAPLEGVPLWRWDSGATAEIAFDSEDAPIPLLLEYDITTGDRTVVLDHLPISGDADMYSVPDPIWWGETTIGFRYDTGANGKTYILVYGTDGEERHRVLVSDLSAEPDSQVTRILPTISEDGLIAALYYPDRDEWTLLSPDSGELTPLPDGFTVAEAPAPNAANARYCRSVEQNGNGEMVILCETGEAVLDAPAARVEISPDGNYYAYATPDGITVGGIDMPEMMIYANERQTPMDDRWHMAWSGTVGRVVPVPPAAE